MEIGIMTDESGSSDESSSTCSTNTIVTRNKRKSLKISSDLVTSTASIELIAIEEMVLRCYSRVAHFKRLKYKGCPHLTKRGEFKPDTAYVDMHRDMFVRQIYRLFKSNFNITWGGHFGCLCSYIKWLDDNELMAIEGDYFHADLIRIYMEQWGDWVKKDRTKGGWTVVKGMFSALLKSLNRGAEAKILPSIKGALEERIPYKGLHVESELKPVSKTLFRAFHEFKKHQENGTSPKINPIFDEALFNEQAKRKAWTERQKTQKKQAFKASVVCRGAWQNQLTRVAAMICFMLTGMNLTPLLNMKRSDVKFKQIKGGNYIFEATKNRANYLQMDSSIGFTKYGKEFIETWLRISAQITEDEKNDWLFPYITLDGRITSLKDTGSPQQGINKLLILLGLPKITSSVLRKTKTDVIMMVTQDIFMVSISANNSVKTVQRSYSLGVDQDHERRLSASTDAMYSFAKGKPIDDAINEAKYNFHDVLSEYDYKRLRNEVQNFQPDAITPLGVRCQDNTQGSAKIIAKILKKNGVEMEEGVSLCTDFLACFECEHHKLVAAVEDVWLMLSFRDTLKDMQQYPSMNSLPGPRYHKICFTVESILARFKEVDSINFARAEELHKSACHPLYSTLYSLNDLMEVFT